ncbi:hypothetical protein, partial [Ensifer aridi]|uniref:hypothetical protein n=1 Tax=Ensifer aridi TaxID=1708715 RepID=UPI001AED0418
RPSPDGYASSIAGENMPLSSIGTSRRIAQSRDGFITIDCRNSQGRIADRSQFGLCKVVC